MVSEDTPTGVAEKIQTRAVAALEAQIAALVGVGLDKEEALSQAKEGLVTATLNGGSSTFDRTRYIQGLIEAKNKVTVAEDDLSAHKAQLAFLKDTLKSVK